MKVKTVDSQLILDLGSIHVNRSLSFLVIVNKREESDGVFLVPEWSGRVHHKVMETVKYLAEVLEFRRAAKPDGESTDELAWTKWLFQAEDCPVNVASVSWETQSGWNDIKLIPDLYYFAARGYEGFLPRDSVEVPQWKDRTPIFFWRGQTTGVPNIGFDNLETLPRYRLCAAATRLGAKMDVGFTGIVQASSDDNRLRIQERLKHEGLIKDFVEFKLFARNKFVIDIDGNTNAWNFLQKLRLGSCVLKVESPWFQWFSDELVPWTHYVPLDNDLHDLEEKTEWCLTHDEQAKDIADNGREFALSMSYATEMRNAARVLSGAGMAVESAAESALYDTLVQTSRVLDS